VTIPSRFLQDIPKELVHGGSSSQRRQQTKARASSWHWSASGSGSSGRGQQRSSSWSRSGNTGNRWEEERKPLPEPNYLKAATSDERARTATEPQFRTGQKVRHAKFGDGTVIESKVTGNDEEVTVAFPDLGVKRLAASFAKLEKLEQ
jgi:DNA helicase-2/ATP-dependent DNA helicase PcrA